MKLAAWSGSFLIHAAVVVLALLDFKCPSPEKEIIEIKIEVQKTIVRVLKKPAEGGVKKDSLGLFANKVNAYELFGQSKGHSEFSAQNTFDTNIDEIFGVDGNKNWSHYREIYNRIDSNLVFDSLLAQYSHFGRVYVQFKVTESGIFKLEDLKADAGDAILKVHVLRTIQKSLSEPLEKSKFSKNIEDTVFQARFDFKYGDSEINFDKQKDFGKPVFVFKRATLEKPVPTELLDQFLTGGVTPNISLMYERWQKYNKKKHREAIQFDPFESYKRDAFFKL